MTITTPTELEVVSKSELVTARIENEPLHKILKGINFLYQYHRPPLADVVLTGEAGTSRDQAFEFVTVPSVDGLPYRFLVSWRQDNPGNTGITIKEFRESDSTYHTINSHTSTAFGAGDQTVSEACNLHPTASRIRVEFTASAAYSPGHVLAFPEPTSTPAAPASGFRAYDDGLWGAAGAPLHTELLNRCKSSPLAVLRDRRQCVLSFCQEHSTGPVFDGKYNTSIYSFGSITMPIGVTVSSLPGQSKTTVDLHLVGFTDAPTPSTNYKIRVSQLSGGPGSSVVFNLGNTFDNPASGSDVSQTQQITLYGEAPRVEVAVITGDATGVRVCVLNSLIGLWRPGD